MFNQLTLTCAFVDEAIPCKHAPRFQYLNEVIHRPREPFLTDADVTSGFSYYSSSLLADGARARALEDSSLLAQIGATSPLDSYSFAQQSAPLDQLSYQLPEQQQTVETSRVDDNSQSNGRQLETRQEPATASPLAQRQSPQEPQLQLPSQVYKQDFAFGEWKSLQQNGDMSENQLAQQQQQQSDFDNSENKQQLFDYSFATSHQQSDEANARASLPSFFPSLHNLGPRKNELPLLDNSWKLSNSFDAQKEFAQATAQTSDGLAQTTTNQPGLQQFVDLLQPQRAFSESAGLQQQQTSRPQFAQSTENQAVNSGPALESLAQTATPPATTTTTSPVEQTTPATTTSTATSTTTTTTTTSSTTTTRVPQSSDAAHKSRLSARQRRKLDRSSAFQSNRLSSLSGEQASKESSVLMRSHTFSTPTTTTKEPTELERSVERSKQRVARRIKLASTFPAAAQASAN